MLKSLFHSKLRVALTGRNLDVLRNMLAAFPCQIVDEQPELVISYGGDGSLLGAERLYPGIPKCALRDARQNPKCPRHDEARLLQQLFAGELDCEELPKLECADSAGHIISGLNDITLSRSIASSALRYRIWAGDQLLRSQVVADALIVATPFGSTGYFQSITHGNFQTGIGLAFSNAMDLTGFTIIPQNLPIRVQLLRGPGTAVADNDPATIPVETDDSLLIQVSPRKTPVFGIRALRCPDCYDLRKHGVSPQTP